MAQFTGRGSGLMEAGTQLETLYQGKQEQQRLRDMADSNMATAAQEREKGALELQAYQEQRAQEQEDAAEAKKAEELLAVAGENAGREAVGNDYQTHLKRSALTNLEAGKEMLKYDYAKGMELIKKGHALEQEMHTAKFEGLQRNLVKNQLAAEAFAYVTDQASLDVALKDVASMGMPVPPKYQKWGVETKQWIQRKAIAAETTKTRIGAEKVIAETAKAQAEAAAKTAEAKTKVGAKDREEKLKRAKLFDKPLNKQQMKADKEYTEVLDEQSDVFKGLDKSVKNVVVRDIRAKALQLRREDPNLELDEVEATKLATQEVLSNLQQSGSWYSDNVYNAGIETTGETKEAPIRMIKGVEYVKAPGGWKRKGS